MNDAEPIYDTRTRCEKRAVTIAALESQAALLAASVDAHYEQMRELRIRVTELELRAFASAATRTPAYSISVSPARDDAIDDDLDGPDPFEDC